jgi:hypothetical protein
MSLSRRNLFLYLTAVAVTAPVSASAAKKQTASPDPHIRLGNVAVPILSGGRVINYVFVAVKLNLTPKAVVIVMKEKEPFFRDRIVHVAHKVDFAEAGRTDRLDEAKFIKVMLGELTDIAGKGMIASLEVVMQNPKARQKRNLPRTEG